MRRQLSSFRRRKETVGDLDILATTRFPKKVLDHFIQFDEITDILSQGSTRSTIRLQCGIQVDLRIVRPESYGSALLYFTGSKAHNIHLRKLAIQKNMKINEYGLFKNDNYVAGKTEESI